MRTTRGWSRCWGQETLTHVGLGALAVLLTMGCGDGGGAQGGETVVAEQTATARAAAEGMEALVSGFEDFHEAQLAIATYDEDTGQAWLDYYDNEFLPELERVEELLSAWLASEMELSDLYAESQSSAAPKGTTLEILSGAALIYLSFTAAGTAVVVTWLAFRNRTVPRVERVKKKLDEELASGKPAAQAWSATSGTFKQAQDEVFLDLQETSAINAVYSAIGAAGGHCAQLGVSLISIAGDYVDATKVSLFGKKKQPKAGNLSADGDTYLDEGIYLGVSDTGVFRNLPLGDWDFVVHKDGYVRGNLEDVRFSSCTALVSVDVPVVLASEAFADDSGPPPGDDLVGGCGDPAATYTCQNLYGSSQLGDSFESSCAMQGGMYFPDGCPGAGAIGACLITNGPVLQEMVYYAVPNDPDPAGTLADAFADCQAISPAAGGPGQWRPYP